MPEFAAMPQITVLYAGLLVGHMWIEDQRGQVDRWTARLTPPN